MSQLVAWRTKRPALSFNFPDGEAAPTVMVFDGEDGYAGLTALVSNTSDLSAGTWKLLAAHLPSHGEEVPYQSMDIRRGFGAELRIAASGRTPKPGAWSRDDKGEER